MVNPITCDAMICSVARSVQALDVPRCKGWDANDPEGCWTHDARRHGDIDYCQGFRLFNRYEDAVEYAEGLGTLFLLGFAQVAQRWAGEPLHDSYGS